MNSKERLKIAIAYIKKSNVGLTNLMISESLGYKSESYVSDLVGKNGKPITDLFLEKLENTYSISSIWIKTGEGEMIFSPELSKSIEKEDRALLRALLHHYAKDKAKRDGVSVGQVLDELAQDTMIIKRGMH